MYLVVSSASSATDFPREVQSRYSKVEAELAWTKSKNLDAQRWPSSSAARYIILTPSVEVFVAAMAPPEAILSCFSLIVRFIEACPSFSGVSQQLLGCFAAFRSALELRSEY